MNSVPPAMTHRERVLEASGGLVDFTHMSEDLGTQRGPVMSRR